MLLLICYNQHNYEFLFISSNQTFSSNKPHRTFEPIINQRNCSLTFNIRNSFYAILTTAIRTIEFQEFEVKSLLDQCNKWVLLRQCSYCHVMIHTILFFMSFKCHLNASKIEFCLNFVLGGLEDFLRMFLFIQAKLYLRNSIFWMELYLIYNLDKCDKCD